MDAIDDPLHPCPRCSYPLPEQTPRCPECAYEPAPEDWAFKHRRACFLEFTRYSWWMTLAFCFAATAFVSVWALILHVPWAFTLFFVAANSPKLHRTLVQRVWACTLPWLLFPWLVAIAALRWASGDWWIRPPWWWRMPSWLSLHDNGLGGVTVPLLIGLLAVCTIWIWRFQWQRLGRIAGLPPELAKSPAGAISLRFILRPLLVLALAIFVLIGVPQLLDVLWPSWKFWF